MSTKPYRVGEDANLSLYPRSTKVGDTVMLTEAQAMYERDMDRLTLVGPDEAAEPVPGETRGHPIDAVSGEPLKLSDEERAGLPEIGHAGPDEESVEGVSDAKDVDGNGGLASVGSEVSPKSRRR